MDLGLNNKHALVLGASRGLGAAVAQSLASEGAHVVAAARTTDTIKAWDFDGSQRVTALQLDLFDTQAIDTALDSLLAERSFDILINNIGGPPPGAAADISHDDWNKYFNAMASNLFHISNRLLPAMRERRWGRIITLSSSGVIQPIPNLALSNAIRAALVGWSKTLSNEVAKDGVNVNVVIPGRIHTDRVDQLDQAAAQRTHKTVEEVARASAASIPAGRYGKPAEFADMVTFLASERASYVTGSCIRVDGGAVKSI